MREKNNVVECGDINLELYFCTEILGLESLHYGYWDNPNKIGCLTLREIRKAQTRYTETLMDFIPNDVESILDVGCGTGDIAKFLASKDFSVTAISPDKNHPKFFNNTNRKLKFVSTKLEKFKSDKKFNLVLMSESQNYFGMNIGFQKTKQVLVPNGYLLVSGMLRKKSEKHLKDITHGEAEYLEKAVSHGFKLINYTNITSNILPTMIFAQKEINAKILPAIKMINRCLKFSSPIKSSLLKIVFFKQLKEARNVVEYYKQRTKPGYFETEIKYLRLLFQLSSFAN